MLFLSLFNDSSALFTSSALTVYLSIAACSAALSSASLASPSLLLSPRLSAFCCSLSSLLPSSDISEVNLSLSLPIADSLSVLSSCAFSSLLISLTISISFVLASSAISSRALVLVFVASRDLSSSSFLAFISTMDLSVSFNSFMSSFVFSSMFSTFLSVILISSSLNLSLRLIYSEALALSSRSPSIRPSISLIISFTLSRFPDAAVNFLSASALRVLYITIPAASSNISRLLSVLLLTMSAILPCPIREYPSTPIPVSIMSSLMSRSLHWLLFM